MRGRPKLQMTKRRKQVLAQLELRAAAGERITLGELVRSCGLYDRSSVKRILKDLRLMGRLV
jgi:hypothetical protein